MIKRVLIVLLATGLVFGALYGFQLFKASKIKQAMSGLANPPQTVSTVVAKFEEWQPRVEAVGSVRAVDGANLSSQVAGIVSAIHFQSGKDVDEGALLLELSAADDIARLKALKATAELSRITYERDKKLVDTAAVSQQTVDSGYWTWKSNEALVIQQQALVNYKSIKAPFAGRIGIRQVDLGQYLAAGTTIVTLQQLDPIYIDFFIPQKLVARVKVGQRVTAEIDSFPDKVFAGEISAINALVDTATRNVQIRATFKNPDELMLPGMFANVTIDIGARERRITLPQTAVAYNSFGDIVYLVVDKGRDAKGEPQATAQQVFIKTGATRGDQVAVLNGVKEGDTVVSAGQVKLRNGSPILINNAVQPANDPDPVPVDK